MTVSSVPLMLIQQNTNWEIIIYFTFFETGFCVARAGFELVMQWRIALGTTFSCLLLSAGIRRVYHHVWLDCVTFNDQKYIWFIVLKTMRSVMGEFH